MLRLEARPQPSQFWSYGSPILALLLTVVIGVVMFVALGKNPLRGLEMFFWLPISSGYAVGELLVKATPLLIIALGLAVCFRSNVWNIGAEGQYIIGAIFAGGVALMADKSTGGWIVIAILLAGVVGGMVWASITAVLRDRFNANEILVSLMLVYVATFLLSYLVYGAWKDPKGYNFPQTITCSVPAPALPSRSVVWPRRRRVMPVIRRARHCGPRCWSPVVRPVWPAPSRWPGRSASSPPTCRRGMALPPSSWPMSGGCIRWAWFSPRC